MAGVNKVILVGNLGADPEARSLNNGGEVVNMRVATSESWKDRDGNRQERTEWHNVVIFNENLGRVAKSYLRKGSKVYLEGQLQTRKWQDQSGNDRYTTEVVLQRFRGELVLLDSRGEGGGSGGGSAAAKTSAEAASAAAAVASRSSVRSRRRSTPTSTTTFRSRASRRPLQLERGERGERAGLVLGHHARFLERGFGAGAARIGIEAERQRVGDRAAQVDRRAVVEDDVAVGSRPSSISSSRLAGIGSGRK